MIVSSLEDLEEEVLLGPGVVVETALCYTQAFGNLLERSSGIAFLPEYLARNLENFAPSPLIERSRVSLVPALSSNGLEWAHASSH